MKTKICTNCKEQKLLTEFYQQKDRKSGASKCKKCHNEYCIQRWIKKKKDAIDYMGNKCNDCEKTYPDYPYVIFDFHHLNPSKKDVEWDKLRLRSWDKVTEELDKCALLCSCCHRIRHHEETI